MNAAEKNDGMPEISRGELLDAGLGMRGFAAPATVNRTHRILRERAQRIEARRSRLRSLWIPVTVSTFLFAAVLVAVWNVLDQYEIMPDALPDSSQQIMVFMMWCLPLSLVVLAVVMFTRGGAGFALRWERPMSMPWNRTRASASEEAAGRERQGGYRGGHHRSQQPANADDLAMIPRWSVVLAILAFGFMQYLFHGVLPHHKAEMLPLHILMGYSWGTLVASYILLVGYVSRDVKRRNMPGGLWMLIVVLMPGGIGAVVYFLLRQPIQSRCPHCATEIATSYNFCPQCQFQMAPVCGQCFRGVEITDVFCKQCGHDLEKDHSPERLRVYRDE